MIPACAASSSGPAQPETAAHGSADARRRDLAAEPRCYTASSPTEGSASTRTASGPDAHWRAGLPGRAGHPPARAARVAAAGHVLAWLASLRRRVPRIGGLTRAHASIEGNALAAGCRLGLAADPRVRSLAGSLIAWQWPDGGWNCDPAANGRRSSFHESLAPAWGLHEYGQATGDPAARDAASRTAGLFLAHRIGRCFSGAPGPTLPRCGTGPRASRARRARWSARPRVLSPFR